MSQSRARQQKRRFNRQMKRAQGKAIKAERELPRCPVCGNQIAPIDAQPTEEGPVLHKTCVDRLDQARRAQQAQRAHDSGLWLPGVDK